MVTLGLSLGWRSREDERLRGERSGRGRPEEKRAGEVTGGGGSPRGLGPGGYKSGGVGLDGGRPNSPPIPNAD